jgi:hypothetical protein
MALDIHIKSVDKSKIRNNDVGDYFYDANGVLNILVAELGDKKKESLIAIHELFEVLTCEANGISEKEITDWDAYCEKAKEIGTMTDDIENGFRHNAPYRKQHLLSTAIEMLLAAETGIDWIEYETLINNL